MGKKMIGPAGRTVTLCDGHRVQIEGSRGCDGFDGFDGLDLTDGLERTVSADEIVSECRGHESQGTTVYCDGSCAW